MSTDVVAPKKSSSLLDDLLAEQQRLDTPVARFSDRHDRGASPALERLYRDLIPLTTPRPGEQYAFEVALDSCTGCKACVSACHSLNGLDDDETWRDTGLVLGGDDYRHPFTQTVTTACHHCAEPACLEGCPVLAYEKDPVTGIVRHLDDQCIGCQYCVLKCPYDVPKYNERLGIVRKCDMCQGRLAEGEAPACVQACPTHAIRIVTVSTPAGATGADTSQFLPGAPAPDYTLPTTRYLTRKTLPKNLAAADAATLRPQPPHWPLVIMLTLVPMAVGCLALNALPPLREPNPHVTYYVTNPLGWLAWTAGMFGLSASVFHLGQPLRAWRIFLGWRRSWLSREALVFGPWFLCTTLALMYPRLIPAAALLGVAGLFCSVMVYVDTRRVFWRFTQTAPRFFGSAAILGFATAFALHPHSVPLASALFASTLLKLGVELRVLRPLNDADDAPTPARQTARLLRGPLHVTQGLRLLAALAGGVWLPFMAIVQIAPAAAAGGALALSFAGEFIERALFFRIVDAPKMPGGPA